MEYEIPKFDGCSDPDDYIYWERNVERKFNLFGFDDRERFNYAKHVLVEDAFRWFEKVKRQRKHEGKCKIRSWEVLKCKLRKQYLPRNFMEDVLPKNHSKSDEQCVEHEEASKDDILLGLMRLLERIQDGMKKVESTQSEIGDSCGDKEKTKEVIVKSILDIVDATISSNEDDSKVKFIQNQEDEETKVGDAQNLVLFDTSLGGITISSQNSFEEYETKSAIEREVVIEDEIEKFENKSSYNSLIDRYIDESFDEDVKGKSCLSCLSYNNDVEVIDDQYSSRLHVQNIMHREKLEEKRSEIEDHSVEKMIKYIEDDELKDLLNTSLTFATCLFVRKFFRLIFDPGGIVIDSELRTIPFQEEGNDAGAKQESIYGVFLNSF